MDKNLLAIEIAQHEKQILVHEQTIAKNQKVLNSTKFNYYSSLVTILLGVLGVLSLDDYIVIWLFLLTIGILTYFTAKSKRSNAQKEIDYAQAKILEHKKETIELRAQLLAHP